MKQEIIAIIGKSASGKDSIINSLVSKDKGLNKIIPSTTRPPREGEVNGVDYYFLSSEEFANKILDFSMIEAVQFREWFYGTDKNNLKENKINVGAYNPEGVRILKEDKNIHLTVFYIIASDKVRLIRSLEREGNPDIEEIFRRYRSDEEDFSSIDFNVIPIPNNGNMTTDEIADLILNKMKYC